MQDLLFRDTPQIMPPKSVYTFNQNVFNTSMGQWGFMIFMLSEKLPVIHWLSNTAMGYPEKLGPRGPRVRRKALQGNFKEGYLASAGDEPR